MPALDSNLNPIPAQASTATLTTTAIASAASTPTQAEFNAVVTRLNQLVAYVAELHADLVTTGIRR